MKFDSLKDDMDKDDILIIGDGATPLSIIDENTDYNEMIGNVDEHTNISILAHGSAEKKYIKFL